MVFGFRKYYSNRNNKPSFQENRTILEAISLTSIYKTVNENYNPFEGDL